MTPNHRTSVRTGTGVAATAGRARRRLGAARLATGLVFVLLAGCGQAGTGDQGGDRPGEAAAPPSTAASPASSVTRPSATSGTRPDPRPTTTVPPRRTSPPATTAPGAPRVTKPVTPRLRPVELRGRLIDGVEPGCVVLVADGGGTWLLVGAKAPLPSGRVRVTGYPLPDLASTCQQGRPLRVLSVTPL